MKKQIKEEKNMKVESDIIEEKSLQILIKSQIANSERIIEFLKLNADYYVEKLKLMRTVEPCKFFKKKHKQWEKDCELIFDKFDEKLDEIEDELSMIEELKKSMI